MPICIPEHPTFMSDAEERVWQQLKLDLPEKAYLLHGLHLSKDEERFELDFLVVWPGHGICNVEVKGGYIQRHGPDNWTTTGKSRNPDRIDPAHQLNRNHFAVIEYVQDHWSQGRPQLAGLAVFADTELPSQFDPPELRRNRIIDRTELPDLVDRIRTICHDSLHTQASREYCDDFVRTITGYRDTAHDFISMKDERAHQVQRWTDEQANILGLMSSLSCFAVSGPAGSGKTYLALEQTHRLTRQGKRIALVCFSRGLARFLMAATNEWPEAERPAFVGTFHQLGRHRWGVEVPPHATVEWWETTCAQLMLQHLRTNKKAERFDGFVVDEAQDMSELWWNVLHEGNASDADNPVLCVFGDADQSLFARSGYHGLAVPPITLSKNLRNTAPIAELVAQFASGTPEHTGMQGPPVRFIDCSEGDAVAVADEQVDLLLEQGWAAGDIALLTTHHRHPIQAERQEIGRDDYWDDYFSDEVFYAHVTGFKGLERPVVIVAIDGWKEPAKMREYLYVALSRARDLLVVCGSNVSTSLHK